MNHPFSASLLILCAGAMSGAGQGLPARIAALGINKVAFEAPKLGRLGQNYTGSFPRSEMDMGIDKYNGKMSPIQIGGDIFVIDGKDATPRKLVSGASDPAWSPDGSELAYCAWDGLQIGQIEVVEADGTGRRQLTNMKGGACFPDWSPDGTKIAFTALSPGDKEKSLLSEGSMTAKNTEVYVVDKNGGDPVPVTEGYSAHWSPGGSLMVLQRRSEKKGMNDSVWLATPDGKQTKMVGASDQTIRGAEWLPGGKGIVVSYMHDGRYSIFRSYLDGSEPQGTPPKEVGGENHTSWSDPAVSPDGKHLMAIVMGCAAVQGNPPPQATCYGGRIVVMDLDTKKEETLAGGTNYSVVWEK